MSKVASFTQGLTTSGRFTWYAAVLDCGHKWYEETNHYGPITTVRIGDPIECSECAHERQNEEWLTNLDYSQVHHSRFDPRFGGIYRFYRLDPTSPSNFMIIGGVRATPRIDAILKTKTNCGPLSPTEPA